MKKSNLFIGLLLVISILGTTSNSYCATVSGNVTYAGITNYPLEDVILTLSVGNTVMYTTTSNIFGYYQFVNVNPATYSLKALSSLEWGGNSAVDALLIGRHFSHILLLNNDYKMQAADVNASLTINSSDALLVLRRIVAFDPSYPSGNWYFDSMPIVVSTGDIVQNIKGICIGDVNASRPYFTGKLTPDVRLLTRGKISVADVKEVAIPIVPDFQNHVGAITLVLNYPEGLIDIMGVEVKGEPENLLFSAKDGILKIAWFSTSGIVCSPEESLIQLKVKMHNTFTQNQEVVFSTEGIESQIADINGEVIDNCILMIPELSFAQDELFFMEMYPNPVVSGVKLNLFVPEEGVVNIRFLDVFGKEVGPGNYSANVTQSMKLFEFDMTSIAAGTYFCRVEFTSEQQKISKTQKLVIAK